MATAAEVAQLILIHLEDDMERFQRRDVAAREASAIKILERCYRYRSRVGDAEETFTFVPKLPGWDQRRKGAPWTLGDLASGKTGSEFTYVYLPVRFVERLLELAEKEIAKTAESSEGEQPPEVLTGVAETITAAGTVYFLNNLREVLDEAVENLFFESATVVKELQQALVQRRPSQVSDRFPQIIETIISTANARRKERLARALWEINPRFQFLNFKAHYSQTLPAWQEAKKIYRANRTRSTWRRMIKEEVLQTYRLELPDDLISLLDVNSDQITIPSNVEQSPSGLALEHSARLCGVSPTFMYSTSHLRDLAGR